MRPAELTRFDRLPSQVPVLSTAPESRQQWMEFRPPRTAAERVSAALVPREQIYAVQIHDGAITFIYLADIPTACGSNAGASERASTLASRAPRS